MITRKDETFLYRFIMEEVKKSYRNYGKEFIWECQADVHNDTVGMKQDLKLYNLLFFEQASL